MKNIFLIGMMGSGKSTLASLLSKKTNIPVYDIDREIEKIMELSIKDFFNKYGEKRFRMIETSFFNEMIKVNQGIYSTGGGIVESKINRDALKNNGFTIFLDCSIDVIINRIGDNIKSRPLLSSNYKIELGEIYESRKDKYKESAHLTINTDKYSKEIIVEKIYNKINV